MLRVGFDKYSFIINDKRVIITSAAIHYFRLPGIQLWVDRLKKLKYAGYNTIDMYFCWSYHSQKQGEYDFSDFKDVGRLMQIVTDLGLNIIARPGPYINAEVSAGGLPGWLYQNKDIIIRNKKDNNYIHSPEYMEHIKEWYKQIIPKINNCPNVIALQVENEYFTNEIEPDYIQELINIVRELGCDLPIMHNDMYASGLYSDLVDIYAIDNYSVTYFKDHWSKYPDVFGVLDILEENIRPYCENSPLFIAELQAGWFDKWGDPGYKKISKILGKKHLDIVTKTALAQGVTAFTHYMGCGGINWDKIACTEVYTSYDFAAPLSENGLPTERFFVARTINNFLNSFDISKTALSKNQPAIKSGDPDIKLTYWLRDSLNDNSKWLFVRNDSQKQALATINDKINFEIQQQEMLILPFDLKLGHMTVNYSTLPLLCRISNNKNQVIILQATCSGEIELNFTGDFIVNVPDGQDNISIKKNDKSIKLFFNNDLMVTNLLETNISINNTNTKLLFIPGNLVDYISKINENQIIVGANYITDINNRLFNAYNKNRKIITIDANGKITPIITKKLSKKEKIGLNNWETYKIGEEIESLSCNSHWQKIIGFTDADSNFIFDGFYWYKGFYSGKIKNITLNIRHCFAVYLNGKEIYSHDSFGSFCGKDTDIPITVNIPDIIQGDNNNITLLIQSLGHNKGFDDDITNPRGLLSYSTSPDNTIKWYIKEALTKNNLKDNYLQTILTKVNNSYLICTKTEFSFKKPDFSDIPLGLVFKKVGFNKANIYLNDNLIGHFWKDKGPQKKFYLPESFYASDGTTNSLKLVIWNRSIDNNPSQNNINDANIYIMPFGKYYLKEL